MPGRRNMKASSESGLWATVIRIGNLAVLLIIVLGLCVRCRSAPDDDG